MGVFTRRSLQLSADTRQGQEVGSPAIFPAQSLRAQEAFGEETGDKKLLQNAMTRPRDKSKCIIPRNSGIFGNFQRRGTIGTGFVLGHFVAVVVTVMGDKGSLKNHGARLVPTGSVGRSTVDRPTR
jgi:hypothetical protein